MPTKEPPKKPQPKPQPQRAPSKPRTLEESIPRRKDYNGTVDIRPGPKPTSK